jgi:hypothetical protein
LLEPEVAQEVEEEGFEDVEEAREVQEVEEVVEAEAEAEAEAEEELEEEEEEADRYLTARDWQSRRNSKQVELKSLPQTRD